MFLQYCLAIDVACGKSMFCILSEAGELVLKPTEYQHTISGFGDVLSELVKLNSNDIHIIMESTSVYHLPVERYFRENTGYETIAFAFWNDVQEGRYRYQVYLNSDGQVVVKIIIFEFLYCEVIFEKQEI